MRFIADGRAWDRCVPAFVLPYAVWTLYVHAIVALHADFDALMRWLPLAALAAILATCGWFRLRDHADADVADPPAAAGKPGDGRDLRLPFIVLAAAAAWVGLLAAGMPYPVFWAVALLATGWAWLRTLRAAAPGAAAMDTANLPPRILPWIVPCVAAAAVCVVLFASRPDADDGFYLSIPATLLRFPDQPVLLHDTMYRLPDAPLLLPFYRLGNYGVAAAVLARLTGIDHIVIAHLVLPAAFAVFGVLAWAWLLRRVVPGRWPVVLPVLFACVMLLGEAGRAYGNFAFLRLFQGKAALATCLVPAIAGAALDYMRRGGWRRWLLLAATLVAAPGMAASAAFVAPAAAALALAGGWSPDRLHSGRFATGMLATGYVFVAALLAGSEPRATHALAIASTQQAIDMPQLLAQTLGPWSARILLVALLAAWAFVRDPSRARYFAAGAFFFLLVALDPYTTGVVARISIGVQTYWRMTWALPLPVFLAVVVDGALARLSLVRPKALAACVGLALVAATVGFGLRSGTLRCANHVALAAPGPKVPAAEFAVARQLSERVPERDAALAPEAVAIWMPVFVSHPRLVGVRHMYLSSAFAPAETARRSNLMRYVGGRNRPPGATRWFADALQRDRISGVAFDAEALWADEIQATLAARGWRPLACRPYVVMVRGGLVRPGERVPACPLPPPVIRP